MNEIIDKAKIIFLDLDGTLLDLNDNGIHSISKENIDTIEELKLQGKTFVISTGRSFSTAEKFIKAIDARYAVTANGAQIYKDGKLIEEHYIGLRESLLLMNLIKKYKLVLKIDGEASGYGAIKPLQKFITNKFHMKPIDNYHIGLHREFYKFVLWGKSKRKLRKIAKQIKETIPNISVVSSAKGWTLEITNENATKGLGNKFVAEKLGITDREQMIHVGDTMNDSTTVEYMNLIAMKNSTSELKNMTTLRGAHYKNGGVSQTLKGDITIIKNKKSQ